MLLVRCESCRTNSMLANQTSVVSFVFTFVPEGPKGEVVIQKTRRVLENGCAFPSYLHVGNAIVACACNAHGPLGVVLLVIQRKSFRTSLCVPVSMLYQIKFSIMLPFGHRASSLRKRLSRRRVVKFKKHATKKLLLLVRP